MYNSLYVFRLLHEIECRLYAVKSLLQEISVSKTNSFARFVIGHRINFSNFSGPRLEHRLPVVYYLCLDYISPSIRVYVYSKVGFLTFTKVLSSSTTKIMILTLKNTFREHAVSWIMRVKNATFI